MAHVPEARDRAVVLLAEEVSTVFFVGVELCIRQLRLRALAPSIGGLLWLANRAVDAPSSAALLCDRLTHPVPPLPPVALSNPGHTRFG